MKLMPIQILLLLQIVSHLRLAATKDENPFIRPDEAYIAGFDYFSNRKELYIKMEEGKANRVFAILSYTGSEKPTIKDGSTLLEDLELILKQDKDSRWTLESGKDLDYEIARMRVNDFEIIFQNVKYTVILNLLNINDNPPIITRENNCEVEEEQTEVECKCEFVITDADRPDCETLVAALRDKNGDPLDRLEVVEKECTNGIKRIGLVVKKKFDFETEPSVFVSLFVTDELNSDEMDFYVIIKDIPDTKPIWTKIFQMQTITEHKAEKFQISAVDGDRSVNAPIGYKMAYIDPGKGCEKISIDGNGLISVGEIDREVCPGPVTISAEAFEIDDEDSKISETISFAIQDINDKEPKISMKPSQITIEEHTNKQLEVEIIIDDEDLGENAQYTVNLNDNKDGSLAKAFQLVPSEGYKKQSFSLLVFDPKSIDFEVEIWRNFELTIHSSDGTNKDSKTLKLTVTNINDNLPIFDKDSYTFKVAETEKKGFVVGKVLATDADEGDVVQYSLATMSDIFEITNDGTIKLKADNALDYERQKVLNFQVQASDGLEEHLVSVQVAIDVQDINDEPPVLQPLNSVDIEETEKPLPDIRQIAIVAASDPDTDAKLVFQIIWEKSYGIKLGKRVTEPIKRAIAIRNTRASAKVLQKAEVYVKANEIIDYEEVEVIYLEIQVMDDKRVVGEQITTGQLIISVNNINDNDPQFNEDSIKSEKVVVENAKDGTPIATIRAFDPDGPDVSLTFTITPNKGTPGGLVGINDNGEITVLNGAKIDADEPRYKLEYKVKVSDGERQSSRDISILISDINDNDPIPEESSSKPVEINENEPAGTVVKTINGNDHDREAPYNSISYFLDNAEGSLNDFSIDLKTGKITLKNGLDREQREKYEISVMLRDNVGEGSDPTSEQRKGSIKFSLTVGDVNDNAPALADELKSISLNENKKKGDKVAVAEASDKDKEGTPNSEISYFITKITKGPDGSQEPPAEAMFKIDETTGQITAGVNLQDYFNTYILFIQAKDHGVPQLESSPKEYKINIGKYNFKEPTMIFPPDKREILLAMEQQANHRLKTIDGDDLPDFVASDGNGDKRDFNFDLTLDGDSNFYLVGKGANKAELRLKSVLENPTKYDFKINVTHDGLPSKFSISTFTIKFLDLNAPPFFEDKEPFAIQFVENKTGLSTTAPEATDPKNVEGGEKFQIYYFLTSDTKIPFSLDKKTRKLTVEGVLDAEDINEYKFGIIATNNIDGPPSKPSSVSIKSVVVKVKDISDTPPKFTQDKLGRGVTVQTKTGIVLATLSATDKDEVDQGKLVFSVLSNTMKVSDDSLNEIKTQEPFKVRGDEILLNFKVQPSMKGYFTFDIQVKDTGGFTDEQSARIYIVSVGNLVTFKFKNTLGEVEKQQTQVELIFGGEMSFTCEVDSVDKSSNANGSPRDDMSEVQVHFIDEKISVPIEKDVILRRLNDVKTVENLRSAFATFGLILFDVLEEDKKVVEDQEELMRILLIVVSVVLGTLCLALFVTIILRTRSFNKRVKAITVVKFGSQESGLNRIGVAPTTNKFTAEGSNPVWNSDLSAVRNYDDNVSTYSGDSDLIGIEDNPEFNYGNQQKQEVTLDPSDLDETRRKSLNPLASRFGYDEDAKINNMF